MPDAIRLVPPTGAVHASYLQATSELREAHGPTTQWPGYGIVPGRSFTDLEVATAAGFERFAIAARALADPDVPLPAGFVHDTRLWFVDFAVSPPEYLGRLSIRHELTPFLRNVGGHIGYVIRPSRRGRGFATRMLAEALPVTAGLGIDPALVTCDDDNVASAKVILANGGSEDVPFEHKRRFWVPAGQPAGPAVAEVFERQWVALRTWLARLQPGDLHQPSVLAGWTVADLVAHLVRSCATVPALRLAPAGTAPQTLNRYVAAYAGAAADIATGTRALTAVVVGDPLGALDRAWAPVPPVLAAFDASGAPTQVVQAARGPIRLADFLLTRIIELVVHGDDLARSLNAAAPLLPAAVAAVAGALDDIDYERSESTLRSDSADDLAWIRLACGRTDPARPPVEGLPLL